MPTFGSDEDEEVQDDALVPDVVLDEETVEAVEEAAEEAVVEEDEPLDEEDLTRVSLLRPLSSLLFSYPCCLDSLLEWWLTLVALWVFGLVCLGAKYGFLVITAGFDDVDIWPCVFGIDSSWLVLVKSTINCVVVFTEEAAVVDTCLKLIFFLDGDGWGVNKEDEDEEDDEKGRGDDGNGVGDNSISSSFCGGIGKRSVL